MTPGKYEAFLGYSRRDVREVEALARYLSDAGLHIWFDRWELVSGAAWDKQVNDALDQARYVLICVGASGLGFQQM
jgi:hypothetical protein